jgi:hypothetical protein
MRRIINFSIFAIAVVMFSGAAYAQNASQYQYKNQVKEKKQVKAEVKTNGIQLRTNWVDLDGDGICDNYSSAAGVRNMKANGGKGMGLQNGRRSFGNGSGYRFGDRSGLHPQDGTGLGFKHGFGTGNGTGTGICDGTGPKGSAKGRR